MLPLFQDWPEILQFVKQVPDIIAGPIDPVWVQVVEGGVVAVALEGCDGGPLDQDHHLARLDATGGDLPELANGHDAPAVGRNLMGRAARVGQVLFFVRNVKEVQGIDWLRHRWLSINIFGTLVGCGRILFELQEVLQWTQ